MANEKRSIAWEGCPIRFGMGIFGDKWTLLIIRDLMFKGKKFFNEFTDDHESISTNILSDRLLKLCEKRVIVKHQDLKNRSKYVYKLTEKGKGLIPVMLAIVDWAERHDPRTEVPRDFISKLRKDPERFRKEILSALD